MKENTMQQGILTLLRSAISGESLPLPEGFSLAEAMETIQSHSLSTLAYAGAARCGLDRKEPAMQQLFAQYGKALLQSEGQQRELRRLFAALDEQGLDYLPVKGSRMKARYPAPELRLMGDADVLIRMEQYPDKICPLMESLGFAFHAESEHELIWRKPALMVELHKCLIPPYHKGLYAYFGDGWARALPGEGSRWELSPEDEFLHLFAHFAKHYRQGGIGLRHVVDLWVFRRSFPGLDEAHLRRELEKLELLRFYENTCRLLSACFADGPWDSRSELMRHFLFASGNWGQVETVAVSRGLLSSRKAGRSRLHYIRQHLFPGVWLLEGKYTILQKAPWMLPLVWLYRPFYKLLFERGFMKRHRQNLQSMQQEKLDRQLQMFRELGLGEKL